MSKRPGLSGGLYGGGVYFPLDPRLEDIKITDIAHSLAMQCRFNGHILRFLSVAEHSVNVSYQVPEEDALEGLLHDAAESYVGDLIRPLKMLTEFGHFKVMEAGWEVVIAQKFGLRFPYPPSVKRADEAVVAAEIAQLRRNHDANLLHDDSVIANIKIEGWSPAEAEMRFLGRFLELDEKRRVAAAIRAA